MTRKDNQRGRSLVGLLALIAAGVVLTAGCKHNTAILPQQLSQTSDNSISALEPYTIQQQLPPAPSVRRYAHRKLRYENVQGEPRLVDSSGRWYYAGRDEHGNLYPSYRDPRTGKLVPAYYDGARDRYYDVAWNGDQDRYVRHYIDDPQPHQYYPDPNNYEGYEPAAYDRPIVYKPSYASAPAAAVHHSSNNNWLWAIPVIAAAYLILQPAHHHQSNPPPPAYAVWRPAYEQSHQWNRHEPVKVIRNNWVTTQYIQNNYYQNARRHEAWHGRPIVAKEHGPKWHGRPVVAKEHGPKWHGRPIVAKEHGPKWHGWPVVAKEHGPKWHGRPVVVASHGSKWHGQPVVAKGHGPKWHGRPIVVEGHGPKWHGRPIVNGPSATAIAARRKFAHRNGQPAEHLAGRHVGQPGGPAKQEWRARSARKGHDEHNQMLQTSAKHSRGPAIVRPAAHINAPRTQSHAERPFVRHPDHQTQRSFVQHPSRQTQRAYAPRRTIAVHAQQPRGRSNPGVKRQHAPPAHSSGDKHDNRHGGH